MRSERSGFNLNSDKLDLNQTYGLFVDNLTKQPRSLVELPCAFGTTLSTPRNGIITSIGLKRCFVKTKVTVTRGQSLFLRVWTTENRWLRLSGRVSYHMEMVGFGFAFGELEEDDINNLAALIDGLGRKRR